MKKMTFALACASTAVLFADQTFDSIGFEGYTLTGDPLSFTGLSLKDDSGSEGAGTASHWLYMGSEGAVDGSAVKQFAEGEALAPLGNDTTNTQYLELSTEGGTLWRSINGLGEGGTLGAAKAVPADTGIYIDTMVQFTPTEDGGDPTLDPADKIAIWLDVKADAQDSTKSVTNLCVRAARVYRDGSEAVEPKTFVLKGKNIEAGAWYRLTIKTISDVTKAISQGERSTGVTGYQISLDGTVLSTDDTVFDASYLDWAYDDWLEDADQALLQSGTVFAGLDGFVTTAQIQGLGFKGSGAIDNVQFTDYNPNPPAPASVDFMVKVPTGATGVKYAIGDAEAQDLPDGGKIEGAAGATVTITGTLADGTSFTKTGTISENGELDLSTPDWSFYLAADAEAATPTYVIDSATELEDFRKGVAAGLATAGVTFKLTDDIDLDGETFPGIACSTFASKAWNSAGNSYDDYVASMKDCVSFGVHETGGSKNESGKVKEVDAAARWGYYKSHAFAGTFDGQGYTISGIVLEKADYTGFFAALYNATVKNLKLGVKAGSNGFAGEATNYGGALVAGVVVDSTIENCETLQGAMSATKALAGIVGYAASGTVIKGCTNNLNLTSANEKVAGLVGCAQNGEARVGSKGVTIEDCTNTGNVTCTTEKKSRAALLVTYTDSKVTFKGTIIAQGTVTQAGSTSNIQSIINISSGSAVVADGAVIKAPAGMKSTIHNNKAHAGLNYATVADGVATFVADSAAVNGANLKVMTTGNTVTLANVGDTITLDTTLAEATVTTTAADAYVAQDGNDYTVTAKADAAFTVSIDPTEAEWTAELTLPTPSITGTEATGSWSPAAIVEPEAGTTNTYTYTVTVAATETTKATTKSVEFKVYKNAAVVYPDYITDDTAKGKFDTWASEVAKIDGDDRKTASMDAYLLNVAPANVDTAKAAFKIVSIEQDAEGAWTVKVTADKKTDGQAYGNGTIEIQGATTLKGPWAKDTAGAKFFKAILK